MHAPLSSYKSCHLWQHCTYNSIIQILLHDVYRAICLGGQLEPVPSFHADEKPEKDPELIVISMQIRVRIQITMMLSIEKIIVLKRALGQILFVIFTLTSMIQLF